MIIFYSPDILIPKWKVFYLL